MKSNGFAPSLLAFCAALLAACGGGSTAPIAAPAAPTPSQTPPGPVSAAGKLVDHDTGAPLSGVAVGLAPWIAGATPVPQPTTDANGNFTISAQSAGRYLLIIGSNQSADPNNRATIHDAITLASTPGLQALAAPTMPPVPSTTPNPIERSGNYRLMTLNANEQACLSYENQKRTALGYQPVVEDEWLAENVRMVVQQELNGGGVGGGGLLTNYNGVATLGCTSMVDNDYTVLINMGNPALFWYGADAVSASDGAVDEGMLDPRGTLPSPAPPAPWP